MESNQLNHNVKMIDKQISPYDGREDNILLEE